ncbi:MAG: sulfatase-like hydrolase/transferase [Planctomycetes bacterium]|nr:sulfatase-like hydrolase/transferase [Planctomycetota bacterium]
MRALSPSVLLRFALLACASALVAQDQDAPLPTVKNVVVLLCDDAGYADFGFQEHPSSDVAPLTPHIDRIAKEGVRFTNAYTSGCVCGPTRAGLLTGRYQQRFGFDRNIPQGYLQGGLSLDERTIADRMRELDRATGLVGKWHLGYPEAYHPNRRGFDEFFGFLMGARAYQPLENPTPHRAIQRDGEVQPEGGYVTDRWGDAAIEFIKKHEAKPFFLYVAFNAVHAPLQPKAEDLAAVAHITPQRRRNHAGVMVGLDRAVGRILDALDEHGLAEDTLVIFTNDNGGQTQIGANNGPLRGRKAQLFEGGIRVPMAMRWPGRITPGTTIGDPVITLDLLPTCLSACGGAIDPEWKLDGVDLVPRITGRLETLPERTLFWRTQGSKGPIAARRGNWKLLHQRGEPDAKPMLFDLAQDIGERRDLAAQEPGTVAELRAAIEAWEAETVEPGWGNR